MLYLCQPLYLLSLCYLARSSSDQNLKRYDTFITHITSKTSLPVVPIERRLSSSSSIVNAAACPAIRALAGTAIALTTAGVPRRKAKDAGRLGSRFFSLSRTMRRQSIYYQIKPAHITNLTFTSAFYSTALSPGIITLHDIVTRNLRMN